MRNGVRVGILGLIVAAMISPGVAVAADFNVSTTADGDDKECAIDCTLREAVVLAGSADRVIVPSGTYVLTGGELSLNNDTIIGAGRAQDGHRRRRQVARAAGDRGAVARLERDDPQWQRRQDWTPAPAAASSSRVGSLLLQQQHA